MSSPPNNLQSLFKRLEQKGCLYQCDGVLEFLECTPGRKRKLHIIVVVEEDSGEKTEHTIAIYEESSQSGGSPNPKTLDGEAMPPPRRISEREKPTTTTTSPAITSSATTSSALSTSVTPRRRTSVGSCRSLKRVAPQGSASPPTKRLRTSKNEAILHDSQTSTRAPLQLRDPNTIPNHQLQVLAPKPKSVPKLLPKPASHQIAPAHSNDPQKEDKANELLGILIEAAAYANIPIQPGTETPELNSSIALYEKKTNVQAAEVEEDVMVLGGFLREYNKLDNQDGYGRVQELGLYARYARFIWEFARKKGAAFDAAASRPTRGNATYGKWDVNRAHLSKALDEILQIDSNRINPAKARTLMKRTRKGEVVSLSKSMREEALKYWAIGRKVLIILDRGGPAAGLCLALGPAHLQPYSMKRRLHRLPLSDKDFDDEGCLRSIHHNRHIFTAWLDARVDTGGRRWRDLLKGVGIHINDTLDPSRVQPGDRYRLYRGIFNEVAKTYHAELFSSKESKCYLLNGGIGEGSSGVKDWETHLDCPAECRCLNCAVWKPPPGLIVETEIKNPNLGKTIVATQHLKPLDYIAEHSGERKTAAESMSAVKKRAVEGQRTDRMEVKVPGQGTVFIHQENMAGPTRYVNHSKTPNAEFEGDPKYVSGAYRTMLRVKPGCHIKPGDLVTVDYGDSYFVGFGQEIYEGPGLLPR